MMEGDGSNFGLASPDLLEKIDRLFACNVGEYVDLPQLVVVRDQSSGKSSVLEALTNLPFPRESGLCTRFATQITFRRSSQEKQVSVSVIPADNATEEHKAACRAWTMNDFQSLDAASFADIMKQVNTLMGLVQDESGVKRTFSNDVLRLEISSPNEDHLSVIDVPGIFKRTTSGVTTKTDMEMVADMVRNYMKNPRCVMLAVVPANVDIATQEILKKAEEVDPEGTRTLGVLTKPDLVDKGAEKNVIDLVEGKTHQLKLGWHLLRNAGQAELGQPITERQATGRRFFDEKSPWNSLEKDKVGIDSFRNRLQEILADHIRREFPQVKAEITKKLKGCQLSLQALGAKRQTSAEQSQYLMGMAMKYQKLSEEALLSNYGRTDVFDRNPNLRLATAVVNRSDQMSEAIATKAHTFYFEAGDTQRGSGDPHEDSNEVGTIISVAAIHIEDDDPPSTIEIRHVLDHPELEDLVPAPQKVPEPQSGSFHAWLKEVYRSSRGFEIGTLNSSLLAVTMKRQSMKWRSFARGYIADIVTIVYTFIVDLLRVVCPIERVRLGIMSLLMDRLIEKYRLALSHVEFLLEIELDGTPATLNHYFNDNLEKSRQRCMHAGMQSRSFSDCKHGNVVKLEDIIQHHPMSNVDHAIQDLHDILQSYYKVARKRFVDSLRMQAVDFHLITGPRTPLKLFSPTFVVGLTATQLEEVAGEDLTLKRRRIQLEKEEKNLEEGKKILS
ncbi:MAG: hypothetical protein Q9217_002277 [Psora testacea]